MKRSRKVRVTVTLDRELVDAINEEVEAGRVDSVSAWFSRAAAAQTAEDRRKAAWREALAMYEKENGVITQEDMDAAERWARENAIHVRPKKRKRSAA